MSLELNVSVLGTKEMARAFARGGDAVKDLLADGIDKIAIVFWGKSRAHAPVRTGNLRRSIQKEQPKKSGTNVSVRVWAGANYAHFVEYGTKFMTGRHYFEAAKKDAYKEAKPIMRDTLKEIGRILAR